MAAVNWKFSKSMKGYSELGDRVAKTQAARTFIFAGFAVVFVLVGLLD